MILNNSGKPLSFAAALALLSGLAIGGAVADDGHQPLAVEVEKIDERGALVLVDGGKLCLPGIRVPTRDRGYGRPSSWRSAWLGIVRDQVLFHRTERSPSHDRYGCMRAHVETADHVPLQHALLEEGWAVVDPSSMADADDTGADIVDVMLRLEDRARKDRRGVWKGSGMGPRTVDDLSPWIGTRQLVEGRVRRISDNDRYVYLNFGADWRTDFTVRLARKMVDAAGIDTAGYDGRKLRVRGVLQDSRGPLIDIAHPKQIELLP